MTRRITAESLQKQIDEIVRLQKLLDGEVKIFVQNKDIPLDERWDFFVKSECGEEKGWVEHVKSLEDNDIEYYDDFYFERHQTVTMNSIAERLYDWIRWPDKEFSEEKLKKIYDDFREEAIAKFIKSFEYDW